MKQRTAILLAFALTAFVLIVVGAVAFRLATQSTPNSPALEPAIVQNVSGEAGITQLDAPTDQATRISPTLAPTNIPNTAQPQLVSYTRAGQIALTVFPKGKLGKQPELVNYKGKMAYEVVLSGNFVYVDAFNGKILGRVAAIAPVPPTPQPIIDTSQNTGGGDNGGGNGGGNDNGGGNQYTAPPDTTPPPPSVTNDPPPQHQTNQGDDDHGGNGDNHDGGHHKDHKGHEDNGGKDKGGDD